MMIRRERFGSRVVLTCVQPLKGCNNAKIPSKPCSCGGCVWVCRQRFLLGSTGQLGMTNEEALQAGTIAPAEMLGQEKASAPVPRLLCGYRRRVRRSTC